MKKVIWIAMAVLAIGALGFLAYNSQLNPANKQPTQQTQAPPESFTPPPENSGRLVEFRNEWISFSYPSNWEAGAEFCDELMCFVPFTIGTEDKLIFFISGNRNPETQQEFSSIGEYLQVMYPDKQVTSERQSADEKVTLYLIDGPKIEVLFQLPESKKIVSLVFQDTEDTVTSVLNSLQILE